MKVRQNQNTAEHSNHRWFKSVWRCTPIEQYDGIPPNHVITAAARAKDEFDKMFVVTVECGEKFPVDPLLVGVKFDDPNYYLIDWWDNDIDPTQL